MRIAVVHNLLPGGAHRRVGEQMRRLEGEVIEICLGTAEPIGPGAHVVALAPRAPRVAAALRAPLRYADLAALVAAWRRAGALVGALGADVVFANPCRFLQAPGALLSARAPALYFCDEPRRVDHDPAAAGSRRRLTRPVYAPMYALERRVDARAVRRAARLVTNSRFTAGEIERAYGRQADVVPLGVSEAFHEASLTSAAAKPDGAAPVLSVGALIPTKGHDLAIAAVAGAGHRRPLVIVAPRSEPRESLRLQELARAAEVELTLRVAISDHELAALYARAHATLYLARREPFGLVALEAQACGSPVIVADEGGLPETLHPGGREWAVPRRAEAVSARLDALEEPARRAGVSRAAREHAAGASWERSAAHVGRLLRELVAA